jgi:hypothetical protein
VDFRRDRNLEGLDVHSRLLGPNDTPRGTSCCGRPCLSCGLEQQTDKLSFPFDSFDIKVVLHVLSATLFMALFVRFVKKKVHR